MIPHGLKDVPPTAALLHGQPELIHTQNKYTQLALFSKLVLISDPFLQQINTVFSFNGELSDILRCYRVTLTIFHSFQCPLRIRIFSGGTNRYLMEFFTCQNVLFLFSSMAFLTIHLWRVMLTDTELSNSHTKAGKVSIRFCSWGNGNSFPAECSEQKENHAERKHEVKASNTWAIAPLCNCPFYIHKKVVIFFSLSCCLLRVFWC